MAVYHNVFLVFFIEVYNAFENVSNGCIYHNVFFMEYFILWGKRERIKRSLIDTPGGLARESVSTIVNTLTLVLVQFILCPFSHIFEGDFDINAVENGLNAPHHRHTHHRAVKVTFEDMPSNGSLLLQHCVQSYCLAG